MAAAETLLARDTLPDAIVAANDEAAIGVLMRLRDARRGRARRRLDHRHRRHAPRALRRADHGHRPAARDGPPSRPRGARRPRAEDVVLPHRARAARHHRAR